MKQAVIIGAGQTGRGFIAPILKKNGYEITFLDKEEALIKKLQTEGEYRIQYFAQAREDIYIKDFKAYTINDKQAIECIAQADIVFTSVFASHIEELVPLLSNAIAKRRNEKKLQIVCCENGVHVKKPLVEAGLDAVMSEGIIFCTTLQPNQGSLDLLCEDYPEIPIDHIMGLDIEIAGMPLEDAFDALIQRKIYTYNFMSAVVCYLGSYCSYEVYGEAANDVVIADIIQRIEPIISDVIAQRYQIPYEQQLLFTRRAVAKFKNKEIYDTIYRNARQVERKLRIDERLFMPLLFASEYKKEQRYFEFIIVAALQYGIEKEELDIEPILKQYQDKLHGDFPIQHIRNLLTCFHEHQNLEGMVNKYISI